MDSEFITLDSRIRIKKGELTEQKLRPKSDEGLTRYLAFIALVVFLVFSADKIITDKKYLYIAQVILIISWLVPYFRRIYMALFVKTWKSRIPLDDIQNVSVQPLSDRLETEVTLHLRNGRKKFLVFREREQQLEGFLQAVGFPAGNLACLT